MSDKILNSHTSTNINTESKLTPEQEEELYRQKREAMLNYATKMANRTIQQPRSPSSSMLSQFSAVQIERFMKNPSLHQKQLRQISNYLYDYSAEYRQIIDYVSGLPSWKYVVSPNVIVDENTDFDILHKTKLKVEKELDKMSLSHELSKMAKVIWKQDVFYGYEHETKDSYLIQHMDADYCKITSQDFDGVLLYSFDFSVFDGNPELLSTYPKEFHEKYQTYKNTGNKWIELDSRRAFAFKINEEILEYPLIPYAVLFDPIFDLDEYKRIQKARVKMDNFMLLVQKIPINDSSQTMDEFLISLDLASHFHDQASNALGEDSGVGLITSPMEISAVKTDKGNKDKDSVATALREVYNSGGISQFLFNSDKSTSTGVSKSIIVDEQKAYRLMRQVERWLNRKLRLMSGRYKMKMKFLDVTSFDEGESFELYLKGAQNGFPTIDHAAASVGMNALELHNRLLMNVNGMGYQEMMRPLATSHTQSSKDNEDVGRPTVSDDAVNESTQKWRETDAGQGNA